MDELLSVAEVARRLGGISVSTVRAWLTQGRMNRTKVGRRTMVRESQLSRVIAAPLSREEQWKIQRSSLGSLEQSPIQYPEELENV